MAESGDDTDLAGRLAALSDAPVLVVGDIMLDRFVTGEVERISPEAPIPVLRAREESAMLGGAGNVLRNLAALGARGRLVGVVGDDAPGGEVRRLVAEAATGDDELVTAGDRPTTVKVRYLAGGQQLLRADHERAGALDSRASAAVVDAVLAGLPDVRALVISDYGKGVLAGDVLERVVAAARQARVPVVVDPKGPDYAAYAGATVVTPNRRELAEASGLPAGDDAEVAAAARHLMASCALESVLVTRSEAGMTLVTGKAEPAHLPAAAREVYDVSGAGDTVVAVVGAALAGGLGLEDAARLANVAAGVVVGKVGTAVSRPDELLRALHTGRLMAAEDKVIGLDGALERIATWRRAGLRVGFTNGCFDLLHPGHIALLHQARSACDRLVVALNSDTSVRRLKGEGRPVQDEAARAAVLASLGSVDMVVLFGEDTPMRLIEAMRPDVLVKGADYTRAEVVGGDFVASYGGEVKLAELAAGHSTSETIKRLRR